LGGKKKKRTVGKLAAALENGVRGRALRGERPGVPRRAEGGAMGGRGTRDGWERKGFKATGTTTHGDVGAADPYAAGAETYSGR